MTLLLVIFIIILNLKASPIEHYQFPTSIFETVDSKYSETFRNFIRSYRNTSSIIQPLSNPCFHLRNQNYRNLLLIDEDSKVGQSLIKNNCILMFIQEMCFSALQNI